MHIAILGNSGSGKSTLARQLAAKSRAAVLDLDTVAWEPLVVGVSRPMKQAIEDVQAFCASHANWIVEGCYAPLIAATFPYKPKLYFLDPGVERCLENCKVRPWEPHKYSSKKEQDAKLPHLLAWVREYYTRKDEISHASHLAQFDLYKGPKRRVMNLELLK